MAEANKDTIYIDIDDEITAIIDKLRASDSKLVALVLPKRASVLQSIVNMKLLKRTADETKKNVVLITSEAGLLPLAGAVGMYVAKTLTSRPEIPAAPIVDDAAEESVDEAFDITDGNEPITSATAGDRPVGELAGAAAAKPVLDDAIETVELDDDDLDAAGAATAATAATTKPKAKKNKKLAIPDFDRFRLWLLLGGLLLIILIVFGYLALVVLPKATIAIKTDAQSINTNVDFTLDTTATSLKADSKTVPAKQVQEQKTLTGTATATGQKNNGNKATGSVTMTAKECFPNLGQPSPVPPGTGVSTGGLTFITQQTTKFSNSGVITGTGSNTCDTYQALSSTDITAQNGGAKYNASSNFTVVGRSDISASGSASGGTDDIVQVISQTDIDSATSKIASQDGSVKTDLQTQLQQQNLYPITITFNAGSPAATNSANVGDAASSVTVTETITYSMLGAAQSDLKALVDNDIKSQIDTSQQGILNEGISEGDFKLTNTTPNGAALNLQTTAEVGPNIDVNAIKQAAVGRKSGDIRSNIKSDPDVTDVSVHFSPFWVTSAPKKLSKITVNVAKPTPAAKGNDSN